MKVLFIILISFSIIILQLACASDTKIKEERQWLTVMVKYLDFEGGFYGLIAKDGTKLLPINLDKNYKVAGCILKIKGHFIKDMVTIHQWGEVFSISKAELISGCSDQKANQF